MSWSLQALLNSSHMYHDAIHKFASYGVNVGSVSIDLPAMMKQKDNAVSGLTKGIEGLFKKNKVTYVKGKGKIKSGSEVRVELLESGTKSIKEKYIIIATGSEVKALPGITIDENKVVSSTGALKLKEVPKKLVVVGAGVIGLEMGSVWSRIGDDVTVVEFGDVIVSYMEGEVRKSFQKSLEKQKMKFLFKTAMKKVESTGDGLKLHMESVGAASTMDANNLLVAAGRSLFTKGLGLKELGVKVDKMGRVEMDHHFKTNIHSIYAIGDVIPRSMLAHKAEEDGIPCVELLAGKVGHVNYSTALGVIYTHLEYANVGLS